MKRTRIDPRPGLRRTWSAPALIALASLVGLVSALLGDGVFDLVSWVALATVVGVVLRALPSRQ